VRFHSANLRATGPRGVVPYLAGRVAALRHKSSGITLRMTDTYDGNVVMFRIPHMRASSVMMGWSGVMQGAVEIHVPFHARSAGGADRAARGGASPPTPPQRGLMRLHGGQPLA
jgi:hypothetical protein